MCEFTEFFWLFCEVGAACVNSVDGLLDFLELLVLLLYCKDSPAELWAGDLRLLLCLAYWLAPVSGVSPADCDFCVIERVCLRSICGGSMCVASLFWPMVPESLWVCLVVADGVACKASSDCS